MTAEIRDVIADARVAFGWSGNIQVATGPHGATAQIWHVQVGSDHYALKEIYDDPPTEDWVRQELMFVAVAVDAGARVPASHPDQAGRFLVPTSHGTWIRCHDWVDLQPLSPHAPGVPEQLGGLLARLHLGAPAATTEFDGEPPDPWYDTVPDRAAWAEVVAATAPWATALGQRVAKLAQLCADVSAVEPATLVVCHRDLHPENVFAGPDGTLVVVDFDDLGPADPGRELARVLFDWFCDRTTTDLDGVRAMLAAYVKAGGPGRITEESDFSMLLGARMNFVVEQARLASDPKTLPRRRALAEREIAVALHIWPTRQQLDDVLALSRSVFG